ncbi:hypothetical protein N7457_007955, partial [Penicillium paradoxum]|uniref:uncharacterized protein n=1 Tax=Penicillium paradoxum TaxID=176176 RepID=UPI0025481588
CEEADKAKRKTYNSEDSLVVTHPTTNSPACGLSTAERTGSPIFHTLWSRGYRVRIRLAPTTPIFKTLGLAPIGKGEQKEKTKTYNSEDSLVVTHPTTNSPACGLSTAERTGSPVFHTLWSYVMTIRRVRNIKKEKQQILQPSSNPGKKRAKQDWP